MGPCQGLNGGPMGVAVSYERGTPVALNAHVGAMSSLSLTHTYALSLSLAQSLARSLALSLSLCISLSRSLSLSLAGGVSPAASGGGGSRVTPLITDCITHSLSY